MFVDVVCPSVTYTLIPHELLVTKVTECDKVKDKGSVSINLWDDIMVNLKLKVFNTLL